MMRSLAVCLGFLLALPCRAAETSEALLALVPGDPGICLIVRDVDGHVARISASPFLDRLRAAPLGKTMMEGASKKYEELDQQLRLYMQSNLKEVREDIFGDGFVFAFWPGKDAADERGLFLLRARKPELLSTLAKTLNDLETKSGNMTAVESRQHKGITYWRRVDKKSETSFVLVRSGLLAVTHDEATLRSVIDQLPNPRPTSPIWQQIRELGLSDTLAVFWLNPRAFDAALQDKAKSAPATEAALHQTVLTIWRQVTTVAMALRLDADLELSFHVRGKVGLAGASSQAASATLGDLWTRFPERSILAVAGQADFSGLAAMVSLAIPANEKEKVQAVVSTASQGFLQRDLVKDVLPNLGPNWGLCLTAPAADRQGWFPDMIFALQVRGKSGERPLEQAIFDAVRSLAAMLAFAHANEGTQLKSDQVDKVAVVSLSNPKLFPVACQPSFAVKGGYLLLGGGLDAIRRFDGGEKKPAPTTAGDAALFQARFSFTEAVNYLNDKQRRAGLVAALAQAHEQSPAEVNQQIDQLVSVLELFKQADMTIQQGSEQVVLRLRLRFAEPLRK